MINKYRSILIFIIAVASAFISGCGLGVPQLHEAWEEADVNDDLAFRIKNSIYCEFREAIAALGKKPTYFEGKPVDQIPDNWGAQITITLQVDETTSAAPNISYNETLRNALVPINGANPITVPQKFSLPFSANLSSQAVRIDKYYTFYLLKNFKNTIAPWETVCPGLQIGGRSIIDRHGSSYLFSNLGIRNWLKGALKTQDLPSSNLPSDKLLKSDVLSYDIKFVVVTTGSINPTWQLVSISTGVGSQPFLSANRTRTHQLLLTIGPTDKTRSVENNKNIFLPSPAAKDIHLTGEIQQAIAGGIRSAIQLQQ